MASLALKVCLCVLLLPAVTGLQSSDAEDRLCAFTSNPQGVEPVPANEQPGVVLENGTIRCSHGSRCYGLWEKKADGEMHLLTQGCWTHLHECQADRCILVTEKPSSTQKGSYRFCCCSHDLCNANYTEAPPTADTPALKPMRTDGRAEQTDHRLKPEVTVLIALVTIAIAAILIVALFLGYRIIKRKQKHSLSAVDVLEAANAESSIDLDNLKLLELIGRGRYGAVFRGSLNERCVAAKLFGSANRQNYVNERSIYCVPLLQQHDNIARFLTANERTTADGRPEFLIIMEYYPHGCLSHYLSLHTVDWLTCCRMTHGVTRGLAFLHTELHRGDQHKPAVAHRDLTSRNVLVRADLSCVLADFGLSMRLTGPRPCRPGDDDTMAISEVGTVRYMSPEVLGGALNLRDCESALKQVDVYALGLLYWESFRRCSDLFPGEAVPEYQLAFQAELGNHPSFEDMQSLVVREKHRPRFPEAWKENSLLLRSLKDTMEDCWDQDAEARLTAQCAEERLYELTLLSTHTAAHNHRNLSHGRWPPHGGSASPFIEDLHVGVVRNLQGDDHQASFIKTTVNGAEGGEKNRNSINYERQQAQARLSTDSSVSTTTILTPPTLLCTISETQHTGGAVPSVPVCLHLTEEDLEATKLDPREVDKNLRESSDENLMEHSQKQFGSESQPTDVLHHQVNSSPSTSHSGLRAVRGVDSPPSSIHPLPKQQNLPQRPTSLHLLPKVKESGFTSSRLKLGKFKSNHRQVETGVAKMNTVMVAMAAEPHLVTTVTNSTNVRSSAAAGREVQPITTAGSSHSAGVPTLVTNGVIGGGRTNPAGPQTEDEEGTMDGGVRGGEDSHLNLLNFSPDEHEPLLSREQLPAESEAPPPAHHRHSRAGSILSGRGSNSNNNNNRLPLASSADPPPTSDLEQKVQLSAPSGLLSSSKALSLQAPPTTHSQSEGVDTGLCFQEDSETTSTPRCAQNSKGHPVRCVTAALPRGCKDSDLTKASVSQASPGPDAPTEALILLQKPSSPGTPGASSPEEQTLEALGSEDSDTTAPAEASGPQLAGLQSSALEPQTAGLMRSQVGQTKARRPERPCSLDLSSPCTSSDDALVVDNGSLSASGEKIKRRVKTPYTLKKWRPASWVVSTDTALDPDFEFDASSSQNQFSSGVCRAGSVGMPKLNQSKSSIAVFLVGGGATATTTSEPDGMTCF
ncbi:bone morphogenetic protein receptor type-2-like [Pundamilia nyererei]|uniref:receptor protein serine/threonine kinase n=1 Tax=Pundamilia nyererei TaxID=303518 RepID=A0A9Y3VYG1_9CICH|nr:PREDICTED: bone morphogenetic protein receptor type-2-like [Pundamilia nyererei]